MKRKNRFCIKGGIRMKTTEERVRDILKKREEYRMRKKKEGYSLVTCIMMVVAVIAGTNVVSPNVEHQDDDFQIAFNSLEEKELQTFQTKQELIKAMKKSDAYKEATRNSYRFGVKEALVYNTAADVAVAEDAMAVGESSAKTRSNDDYSETNTQVQGVDEADIVKTNGNYIYYLNRNVLRIFDNTGNKLTLRKEIDYNAVPKNNRYGYNSAREMFLTEDYLIVILNGTMTYEPAVAKKETYYDSRNSTKMIIYNLNNYEVVREVETEGRYLSSRKVDDDIYLITNKSIYYHSFNEDEILPLYKDTCVNDGAVAEIPVQSIKCFPSFVEDSECSYLIITAMSLDKINEKATVETYLGTGDQIYCSKDNLYVTKTKYTYRPYRTGIVSLIDEVFDTDIVEEEYEDKTETIVRKFAIYDGKVKYVAEGNVPGTLLNQFSMDEYQGYFRITTTKGDTWNDSSENNLYVLNDKLEVVGKLEGLAKGEKIYSTRFMGNKAYVVTYKTVDPLFVLDLSNPQNPTVLGELKIPGYSSYLHPLGEDYLIGFGEDSVEKTYRNYDGTTGVTAYSVGLKLAIFDVSDLNNPKELDSVRIGGRGSSSQLLHNHKSLLFKEDEGLFAFPVSLYEENAGYYEDGTPKYGNQEFEGFVVFDLSVENGIKLRGKIAGGNNQKYYYNDDPQRIIYIGDKLYSLFGDMIKVNQKDTMEEVDKITFESKNQEPLFYID